MVKIAEPSSPPIYPNLDEVQHVQDSKEEDEGETFRLK